MEFSQEERTGIGIALNEARLIGAEVDADRRLAGLTFVVLQLPEEGPVPVDSRVQVLLYPVGRVAASLRYGLWDDAEAPAEPFQLSQLLQVVQSFQGQHIYGWNFLDTPDKGFAAWSDRLSLDFRSGRDGLAHTLTIFQEEPGDRHRILDVRIWFDTLRVNHPSGVEIPLDKFIAAGKRWWDGLYQGDPRTEGVGIHTGQPSPEEIVSTFHVGALSDLQRRPLKVV